MSLGLPRTIAGALIILCSVIATDAGALAQADSLKQAESDLAKGYARSAITSFNLYLKKNPDDVRAIVGLGLALKKNGDAERAIPYLRKALRVQPANVPALVALAEILSWKEHTRPEAIALLERAAKSEPDNFEILFQLGTIASWSEDSREQALEYLLRAQALRPKDPKTTKTLAELYRWTAKFPQAENFYRQYLELDPKDTDARYQYAKVLSYSQARREEAIREFDAVLEKEPGKTDVRLDRALALAWMRRLNEAIPELRDLVAKTDEPAAVLGLAQALNWAENRSESEKYYRQYLDRKPTDFKARQEFAELLSVTPETRKEAIALFDKLLSEQPQNDEVRFARAVSLAYIRDYSAAIKDLTPLVDKDPLSPVRKVEGEREELTPILALAQISNWAGYFAQAEKLYRRYLATEVGAKDSGAQRELALVLSYQPEKYAQATEEITNALRRNPDDPQLTLALGELLLAQKKYDDALNRFTSAIARHPENKQLKLGRLKALANLGRHAEADKELEDLDDAEALLILGRVQSWSEKTREQGIKKLRQYVQVKPENSDAQLSLAQVLSWSGKRNEALKIYEQLMCKNSEELTYSAEHAMVTSWTGKLAAAQREYNAVLKRDPDNRAALIGLGQVKNWSGDHFQAEKLFSKASQRYPGDVNVDIERALNYQQMGRLDKAYQLVEQALKRQNAESD
jgi:tetratricopeptide (TPR) repeat protein